MNCVDFLFYSYYSYFNRRNKRHPNIFWGDSRLYALCVIYLSFVMPCAAIYALIDIYITPLPPLPKVNTFEDKLLGLVFGIVTVGPLIYRYYYNKKITKQKFKIFKTKWGDDPRMNKKGRVIVIIYTIVTIIFPLLGAIILTFIR